MQLKRTFLFKRPMLLAGISLVFIFTFANQALAGVNLEVPIDMLDRGLASKAGTSSGTTFERSSVYLNPDDYDGSPVFYFEIIAKNKHTANRDVKLQNVTVEPDENMALITVPTGTDLATRFARVPFTPTPGLNKYSVRVQKTDVADKLKVYTARIIVVQTNATKTRIQIPLVNHAYSGSNSTKNAGADLTTSTTYTQGVPDRFSLWQKDTSAWGDIGPEPAWTFEAVIRPDDAGETSFAALFDSDGNIVGYPDDPVEVSLTGQNLHLCLTKDFRTDAANFDDLDTFEVKHKITDVVSGVYNSVLARASLYVRLTNLNKGEVYWRVSKAALGQSALLTHGHQRVWLNTDNYSSPTVYHESTGYESVSGTVTTKIWDHGTADSDTVGGSEVPGSEIAFTTTKARHRTSAITVTSGNRFIYRIYRASGTIEVSNALLVVAFAPPEPTDHYVDPASPSQEKPYKSWITAAHTIQKAIDICDNGKVIVRKAAGAYGPITMKSHVKLVAENPHDPLYRPVITGVGAPCVVFEGPLNNCTLENFQLANGSVSEGQVFIDGRGGPVTNVTLSNCWLYEPSVLALVPKGAVSFTLDDCEIDGASLSAISPPDGPNGLPISDTGYPIVIKNNTRIHGNGRAAIVLNGDGNIKMEIRDSEICDNGRAGIRLHDFGSVTIDNTHIYGNGWSYGGAGIWLDSVPSITITRNTIHDNNMAGIRIEGSNSSAIVGADLEASDPFAYGNNIYRNYAGISTGPSTTTINGDLVIRGNHIYNNSAVSTDEGGGIWLKAGVNGLLHISENEIAQNQMGGIGIRRAPGSPTCTLVIAKNDIHDQIKRGGIHTGGSGGGFGNPGNFTAASVIKQNRVHHNVNASYGGGIDVRHFRGTIKNNLVYRNSRGGIRYGDYVDAITNNTVVFNGLSNTGGGIIFDDFTDDVNVNDPPSGAPSESFPIKNNISAYNVRAGIRACFYETEDIYGDKYRDHNLLYSNNQAFLSEWCGTFCASPDCSTGDIRDKRRCRGAQLGAGCDGETAFCCSAIGATGALPGETLIFAQPQFESILEGGEDYDLKGTSPAKDAGDCNGLPCDMGAYGGPEPFDDNAFPPALEHCLIDGDITTGNAESPKRVLYFDLGGSYTVTHVRVYGSATECLWNLYVSDTSDGCPNGTEVLHYWPVGGASQWYQGDAVPDTSGRYIKLYRAQWDTTVANQILEFEFTDVASPLEGDWRTPVSVVSECTSIPGLCKQ